MRAALPVIIAGGAVVVLAAGGSVVSLAYADPAPAKNRAEAVVVAPEAKPAVLTDADRRADLNLRMQAMIRDGRGRRLDDARPAARTPTGRAPAGRTSAARPSPRPAVQRAAPRPADERPARRAPTVAGPIGFEPASTIAPPAYAPRGFSLESLTRPRLDLTSPPVVPTNPVECLTQAVYYEARSESEEGQAAVAAVVMNRSRSGRYPADVCQVVYQRNSRTCQFTFTCDGSIGRRPVNLTSWARAERIAREVYEGRSQVGLPGASVNYHADYVRPTWGKRLERVRQIGAHIFYGAPLPGYANPGARQDAAPAPTNQGLMFVRIPALDQAAAPVEAR